jgi:predicted RNase H-like nuclease (RuvC/YqgF family)
MTAEIQTVMRRRLLVQVEPIEIELEDSDGSLLFANLQSAFPGCSSLYYQTEKSKTKSAVKFDGSKFHAPNGDWEDREYYVTLGGRSCHFPFGSYENASKQFEKSVNLVSKLMGGKRPMTYGEEILSGRRSPVEKIDSIKQIIQSVRVQKQDINLSKSEALQRTAAALEAADLSNLTPLEQQFVDLARISTAKDSIIETQRAEIRKLQEELHDLKKKARETKEELQRSESRCRAQDEELTMLRNLGKEQTYMCDRVNDLTKRLVEAKDETDKITEELNTKIELEIVKSKLFEKECQEKSAKIEELETALDRAQHEVYDLKKDLEISDSKLIEQSLQFASATEERAGIQDFLASENTTLIEKNEKLQQKCEELTKKCEEMESLWNQKIHEALKQETERNNHLTEESKEQEKKIAELSSMIDQMARENNELNRRFETVKLDRDEIRRSLAMADSRSKDKTIVGSPLRY